MKIIGAILFLVLVVTVSASSQWKKEDKRAEDAPDRKSLLPFHMWLPDELAFEYSRFSPRDKSSLYLIIEKD